MAVHDILVHLGGSEAVESLTPAAARLAIEPGASGLTLGEAPLPCRMIH